MPVVEPWVAPRKVLLALVANISGRSYLAPRLQEPARLI
jgi:hypothetical protein